VKETFLANSEILIFESQFLSKIVTFEFEWKIRQIYLEAIWKPIVGVKVNFQTSKSQF